MRAVVAAVAVGFGGVLLTADPGRAQSLTEAVQAALSNNCAALSGPYGAELNELCRIPATTSAAASGGTITIERRAGAAEEERRIQRRLKERREGASNDAGRGLSLFVTGDYQAFDKDRTRFEVGYRQDTAGTTVGADLALGRTLVLGAAVSYAHEFGDFDGVGGGFDNDAVGLTLYGSVAPAPGFFLDGQVGYTYKDYSIERRVALTITGAPTRIALGRIDGDTESHEARVSVSAGYDFVLGALTVGPRAGVHWRETAVDGFQESGNTGIELIYDDQHVTSVTTTLGLYASFAISTRLGVLVPHAIAEYVHEFADDQRRIGFRFAQDQGQTPLSFQTDPPDRNYANLGVGAVMVLARGVSPYLDYRALVGYDDRSSHTVTLGLRFEF